MLCCLFLISPRIQDLITKCKSNPHSGAHGCDHVNARGRDRDRDHGRVH